MDNYYEEILNEIRALRDAGDIAEASALLKRELNMPYIPEEAEQQMRKLQKDLVYLAAEKKETTETSLDELLRRLKGKPKSQLAAASRLAERNLRGCIEEIRDYLAKDPCPEAAVYLVDAIAEQQIGEEFVLMKDGVEYTFWGDDVIPAARSKGFLKADRYLKEWLEVKNPDLYYMCRSMLIHEVYMFLPLSYDEDEAEDLAFEMVKAVSAMMDDGETAERIRRQYLQI